MRIGEASRAFGVSVTMIRHDEAIGLLPTPARTEGGYRVYEPQDVQSLRFIANARALGFPIPKIAELLGLWRDRRRASAEVTRLALAHLAEIEEKVRALRAISATLRRLASTCRGDDRPHGPILDGLAAPGPPSAARAKRSRPGGGSLLETGRKQIRSRASVALESR